MTIVVEIKATSCSKIIKSELRFLKVSFLQANTIFFLFFVFLSDWLHFILVSPEKSLLLRKRKGVDKTIKHSGEDHAINFTEKQSMIKSNVNWSNLIRFSLTIKLSWATKTEFLFKILNCSVSLGQFTQ